MNRIFKVIWSKTKHCYIVVSEYAKANTKAAHTGLRTTAAAAAVAAMLLAPVNYNYAWAADTVTVEEADTSTTTQVYTKDGADNTFVKKGSDKTSTALHISSSGDLIVGTRENQTVKDMEIRGKLTSGSISTGGITSTGDVTVTGKMAADGVTDETTKDGTYIKQNNTVGKNLGSLDTQVKANADAVSKLDTRITNVKEYVLSETNKNYVSKTDAAVQDGAIVKTDKTIGENVTNLDAALAKETAARLGADAAQDKVIKQVNDNLVASVNTINKNVADGFTALNQVDANEAVARQKADNGLNDRITNEANAIHDEIKAGDEKLDTRITNVKEYLENQTSENYVSKTDAAVQDAGVVKADKKIGENVTALGKGLYDETAARIGADKAQDKVIEKVNQNMVDGFNTINTNMANGFAALNQADANEAKARADADAAEKAARIGADKKLAEAVNSGISLSDDNVLQKNTTNVDDDGNVTTEKADVTKMILNKDGDNQITLSDKGIKVGLNSGVMDKDGFYAGGDTADKAKAALKADGSIKGADGKFTVDADGKVTAAYGKIGNVEISSTGAVSGVTDLTASGTITGNKLTDGVASLQNGNLTTTGNINAHDIVATGDISGKAITGTSLNTQGGDINGGAITGTTITGTTGSFGSLTTAGNASVGGTLSSNGLTNTGNATTDTLTVNHNATVGGSLAVTGDIIGKSLNVGTGAISGGQITGTGLDVGAGTIKTTSAVETGTLETTGNAEIGGNLTVDKNLTVNGTFDAKTLSSTVDANNYTTINGGKTQSMNLKMDAATGETKASASTFDENGSNTWAKDDDSIGKSTVTADGISQRLSDTGDNPTVYAERTMSQGTDNKYSMVDTVKDGDKTNVASQSAAESSSILADKDGLSSSFKQNVSEILNEIHASDAKYAKLDQKADTITSEVKDGENTTSTTQTATDLTNTAKNGTITNDANKLVNTASDTIANTAANNITNTSTDGNIANMAANGTISNAAKNLTNTAAESITNTATNGNISNFAANGTITNDARTIANKAAEAMTNEAKTITSTASESVTTQIGDGSAVKSVMNDAGIANMATGKVITNDAATITNTGTASVTNQVGSNKVLVDTTHVQSAFGDNIFTTWSESGITNTATDKTVATNAKDIQNTATGDITNSAANGTVTNTAKALVNTATGNMTNTVGGNLIDTIMGTSTTTVTGKVTEDYKSDLSTKVGGDETHAVTGNQTTTVSGNRTVNVKGTETENFNALETNVKTDQKTSVGGNQTTIVTGNQTNNVSGSKNETVKGSVTEKYGSQATTVDGDRSTNIGGNQTTVVAKDQTNTVSGNKTETVKGDVNETYGSQTTKVNGDQSTTVTGKQTNSITGDQVNTIGGNQTTTVTGKVTEDYKSDLDTKVGGNQTTTVTGDSSLSAKNITNKAEGGTIYNKSKDILNEVSGDILNFADGEIGNSATKITNLTGDNTVTSDTNGTTFENKAHSTAVKEGTITKTTISGNTITTGKAVMDYADVMKDLGVRGNAAVDGNTTLGKEDADTTLTVNSKSTFKDTVKMEKTLEVDGTSNFNDKVTVTKGGLNVTGGTTTDTLHVTRTSTFDGTATFKDIVTMEQDLSVGGNATVAGDVTANSYKVGDKTYIDETGINANGQKIKNVVAGTEDSDAANYGQLRKVERRVDGVENRVTNVENRVDKMDSRIDKVGANAAAMANLHPLEFDEDSKWNVAAAVGNYKGETAAAVGAFYRPNEDVMFNLSTTFGNDENMVGGGLSLRLGKGGNHEKDKKLKAAIAENNDLRAKVDDLTARMDALLSVINPNMSKEFPDVPENHWAYEAVTRLAGNDIVQGYEDGKFHGERTMTRYEMAEIIYNALSRGAKAEKKLVEEFKPELQAMAAQKQAK
ncbi:ESPR-type extended signal peptide-containing protein [Mitsuokella jalaludinii]|uniref:ESPR-type extended signal peptide-containing protein n=2 Tax=Mitsuokella TaxID=52225 RepID=UPI0022E68CEF|nr:ESPR-type extended signal peptide-containing protein [Mitsuokella jalaludinii]